jgi:hypothetical protein
VQCSLDPELTLAEGGSGLLNSNLLELSVRPPLATPLEREKVSVETGEVLKAERLPPDEVVSRTIRARQKALWNEFFLYLDLESLLTRDSAVKKVYAKESDDGRLRMVEKYRGDLRKEVVDSDIVVIPVEFSIIETTYRTERGEVRVLEKFQYPGFKMLKEYTYFLRKVDEVWRIYDYTVMNKGTE